MSILFFVAACSSDYVLNAQDEPEVGSDPSDPVDSAVVDTGTVPTLPPSADATTRGQEFWVGFMENLTLQSNGPPDFSLMVTATEVTDVVVVVPSTGLQLDYVVDAGTTEITLPPATWYPEGSDIVGNTGFQVVTSAVVDLVALHHRLYFSEASLILPVEALGTEYYAIAVSDSGGYSYGSPSEMLVVATRDGTRVEITPSVLTSGLRPGGTAFSVDLDAGQVYQIQAVGDLSGTRVTSDAPVAVFGGARDVAVRCNATSHLWDQVLPVSGWGTEYVVVPFHGRGGDQVTVVASEDGTTVRLDCDVSVTLDAGETYLFMARSVVSITADAPIEVGQAATGLDCSANHTGDPSLLVLSPAELYRDEAAFTPMDHPLFYDASLGLGRVDYVSLVVPTGASVDLDGLAHGSDLVDHDGRWATVDLPAGRGTHAVSSLDGLRGASYGFSVYNAYTVGLGYDCVDCTADLLRTDHCD